jgi:hypothetical protein
MNFILLLQLYFRIYGQVQDSADSILVNTSPLGVSVRLIKNRQLPEALDEI